MNITEQIVKTLQLKVSFFYILILIFLCLCDLVHTPLPSLPNKQHQHCTDECQQDVKMFQAEITLVLYDMLTFVLLVRFWLYASRLPSVASFFSFAKILTISRAHCIALSVVNELHFHSTRTKHFATPHACTNSAIKGNLGVQCLAQGHFHMWKGGARDRTTNFAIHWQPVWPSEPQLPPVPLMPQLLKITRSSRQISWIHIWRLTSMCYYWSPKHGGALYSHYILKTRKGAN